MTPTELGYRADPPEIGNLVVLKELYLHNNRLTGSTGRGIADDLAALLETESVTALERKKVIGYPT